MAARIQRCAGLNAGLRRASQRGNSASASARIRRPANLHTAKCGPGTCRSRISRSRASRLVGTVQSTVKFCCMTMAPDRRYRCGAEKLTLVSTRLAAPEDLGDYSLRAGFDITDGKYAITKIVLRRVDTPILSGDTELVGPDSNKPELGIHLGGFRLDAAAVKQTAAGGSPSAADLVDMLKRLGPGKVTVGDATLSAALEEIKTAPLDTIRKNLVVSGTDRGRRIYNSRRIPRLPPVSNLSAQTQLLERSAHDFAGHREIRQLRCPRPRRERQPGKRHRGRGLQDQRERRRGSRRALSSDRPVARSLSTARARSPPTLERPRRIGRDRIGKVEREDHGLRPRTTRCARTRSAPSLQSRDRPARSRFHAAPSLLIRLRSNSTT